MKQTRTGKRRAAAITSVKILLTSASLAATLGGWAAISAANVPASQVAQVAPATATVQAWLDSRSATASAATATSAASTGQSTTIVAPTATAVPTRVVVQPAIRTRSSR